MCSQLTFQKPCFLFHQGTMILNPMSLDQFDRVLGALDILCNVRWQALQPHRDKARLALEKLQVFFSSHGSSESPSSAQSNDGPASPSDRSHSPRSIRDNNDLASPPHHSDSPPSLSESHVLSQLLTPLETRRPYQAPWVFLQLPVTSMPQRLFR